MLAALQSDVSGHLANASRNKLRRAVAAPDLDADPATSPGSRSAPDPTILMRKTHARFLFGAPRVSQARGCQPSRPGRWRGPGDRAPGDDDAALAGGHVDLADGKQPAGVSQHEPAVAGD